MRGIALIAMALAAAYFKVDIEPCAAVLGFGLLLVLIDGPILLCDCDDLNEEAGHD